MKETEKEDLRNWIGKHQMNGLKTALLVPEWEAVRSDQIS
jgi:hypothetical protein